MRNGKSVVKLEDIKNKYPFMYDVNGEIYYIGTGVFRLCNSSFAISYFERYREIISRIGRENISVNNVSDDEIDKLIYVFRKVKAYSNVEKDFPDAVTQINKLLEELSYEEQMKLLEQLEDYVYVFQCYNKRF